MREQESLFQKQFNEQLQNHINYSKDYENQLIQIQKQQNQILLIKGIKN